MVGSISTKIGQLTNLEVLSISHNKLTGTIPTEIGLIGSNRNANLTYVGLSENKLTGKYLYRGTDYQV